MEKASLAKLRLGVTAGLSLALAAYTVGCGRSSIHEEDTAQGSGQGQGYLTVKGAAGFGTQCPFGSISGVKPVALQLWDCPIGGNTVELAEPMKPIFLQADCKKFYLTARTQERDVDTMWEVFPDGTFFFTLTGFHAKIAGGTGNALGSCTAPLSIDIFGKVDCTDPDKANISFEAVMWTGKPNPTPTRSSSPIPTSSPSNGVNPLPIVTPTFNPSPEPAPTVVPIPAPTRSSNPIPFPNPFPTRMSGSSNAAGIAAVNAMATPAPSSTAGQCAMPQSCYFYTRTELKQCQ